MSGYNHIYIVVDHKMGSDEELTLVGAYLNKEAAIKAVKHIYDTDGEGDAGWFHTDYADINLEFGDLDSDPEWCCDTRRHIYIEDMIIDDFDESVAVILKK